MTSYLTRQCSVSVGFKGKSYYEKLSLEAKPEDTLKAYKEIMQLRKRILDGEPLCRSRKESDDHRQEILKLRNVAQTKRK